MAEKHLYFFTGGEPPPDHPLAADSGLRLQGVRLTHNHVFRVVHDAFGHGLFRRSFGPQGEEQAWLIHASMYANDAIPALTSETRGQNAWFNFGPHAHLKVELRPFADQKAALLPDEFCRTPSSATAPSV